MYFTFRLLLMAPSLTPGPLTQFTAAVALCRKVGAAAFSDLTGMLQISSFNILRTEHLQNAVYAAVGASTCWSPLLSVLQEAAAGRGEAPRRLRLGGTPSVTGRMTTASSRGPCLQTTTTRPLSVQQWEQADAHCLAVWQCRRRLQAQGKLPEGEAGEHFLSDYDKVEDYGKQRGPRRRKTTPQEDRLMLRAWFRQEPLSPMVMQKMLYTCKLQQAWPHTLLCSWP